MKPLTFLRPSTIVLAAALVFSLTIGAPAVLAQSGSSAAPVTIYKYSVPGKSTIVVNLWGDIGRPGRYEIPRETDLIDLLFLAGAPGERTQSEKQIRKSTVHVWMNNGSQWTKVFEKPLTDVLLNGQSYVLDRSDFVVNVETKTRERLFSLRNTLSLIGSIGAVIVVWDRVLSNRSG